MMTWSKRPARWLTFTAIIELTLAALFLVLRFTLPAAASGMFVAAAAILGVTGIALFVWARKSAAVYAEAERLRQTGLDGNAAITGMRQTGLYLNQQPQVELQLQITAGGRPPYTVTVKEFVPLILIGRLSSGAPLPVKVDPQNPQNIVIDWQNAGSVPGAAVHGAVVGKDVAAAPELVAQASAQGMLPSESELQYRRTRLRQFGKPGVAVVQSAQDTGQRAGKYQIWLVDLVTTIDGVTTDVPASVAAVPSEHADKVIAGSAVPLRVDPKDPDQITLLWEEAKPPAV